MKRKPRPDIRDAFGKKITMKKLRRLNEEDLLARAIRLETLISEKILSRSQIDKFEQDGVLHKIEWHNGAYFDKKELRECLRRVTGK